MSTKTLEATILGCGSSGGVPRLGGPDGAGDWGACDPANPKNRRRRCSLLLRRGGTTAIVDTSPDMREQLLEQRIGHLDAVLMTHAHADQTHGIDDLRPIAYAMKKRVDMYADTATLDQLKMQFFYCFTAVEGYSPIIDGHYLHDPLKPFSVEGAGGALPVRPFWQAHGPIRSLGYRIGPLAYSADVSDLDETAFQVLEGVEVWILDALRYRPHPTHANVEKALAWIARVKPRHAVLTNLHHEVDYETLRRAVPKGVEPAYDGLSLTVELDG